jgi:hypothetical protein
MPEEILLEIVKAISTSVDPKFPPRLVIAPNIFLTHGRVYFLSRVNKQFRRLCLPVLYEMVVIKLAEDDSSHESTSAKALDVFRRNMMTKPHVAGLVK